jgi:hypothetical protein
MGNLVFYGMDILIGLALLICVLIFYSHLPHVEARRAKERKQSREQILSLFVAGEEILSVAVARRLRERTGGKKDIPQYMVIVLLEELVSEGELCRKEGISKIGDMSIRKTTYCLPEQKPLESNHEKRGR